MPHDVIMPALGMAQDTGLIVAWLKSPGDAVKADDPLMEVETDKAVMEVPAGANGFLTRVMAAAGDSVPVGQVVAVIGESADDGARETEKDSKANPAGNALPRDATDDLPQGERVIMPALGMAQDTGTIVAWMKAPGDKVAASDILLELETDKSVVEVEAGHDGYVAAILADAQQAVPVGSVIAIISATPPENPVARSHAPTNIDIPAPASTPPAPTMPMPVAVQPERAKTPVTASANGQILASPKARRLVMEAGLDLALLVEHGVPQPYHVADLETLKQLHRTTPATAARASAVGLTSTPVPLHIAARVSAARCDEMISWLVKEDIVQIQPRHIWLRFATAAFRESTEPQGGNLIVETRGVGGSPERFLNADRSRFSQPLGEVGDGSPSLVVLDLSGSPIVSITSGAIDAPVLSVGREHEDYLIALDFHAAQLDENQAIKFVTGFAERLDEPLRHIL